MSKLIIANRKGRAINPRFEPDEYEPGEDEVVVSESVGHYDLHELRFDESGEVYRPVRDPLDRPGVVDDETRELIAEQFLERGADAIAARDVMAADDAIPQSVIDYADATISMHYLIYVSLTGDRIDDVEARFF